MDYSVCIKVSPEVYERYKDRLLQHGVESMGYKSRIGKANRSCFEYMVENMSDEVLNKILEDLG